MLKRHIKTYYKNTETCHKNESTSGKFNFFLAGWVTIRFMTTQLKSLREDACDSSLSKYGMAFEAYFVSTSTAYQNLIPTLSGFLGIYCVNLHRAFVGKSCLSIFVFALGL